MRWRKLLLIGILGLTFVWSLLFGFALFTYGYFSQDLNNKELIMNKNNSGLILLDRTGKPFFTFYQGRPDQYIALSDMPPSLQQAVIASEDKDFYTNPGFSIRGIIRALVTNAVTGKIVQGGSTITQELVKNELLNSNKSYFRKYQEIVLSYELNRRYSKNDILEMYLNSVYFGEGAFGAEDAAQTYFGTDANNLDLAQSALLTGLLPAPTNFSPLSNDPAIAKENQLKVLDAMVKNGAITQAQADSAAGESLSYNPKPDELNRLAPHFALMVRDMLNARYGEEFVIRSGLQVKTTLDSSLQEYAQNVVSNQVAALQSHHATNGAAVIIDPKTGQILSMVGSIGWDNTSFGKMNMAITPRQVGSSFKPIIYSAAFERNLITSATILKDQPTTFPGNYKPTDYDHKWRGPVTVRRALANSLNVPAVEVMQKVGVPAGLAAARSFGITTLGNDASNYGLSLVLGAGEVRLDELTDAYSTFANNGVRNELAAILEVKDKYNNTIESFKLSPHTVIDKDTAFLISSILSDNKARAEEFGNVLTINRSAAVKTGTTQDYKDALTVGYTPSVVIGVWVGNNDNTPMDNVAGSLGAAPIWKQLMEHYLDGKPNEQFNPPSDIVKVTVCPNLNPDQTATSSGFTEYMVNGTQSDLSCPSPTPQATITPIATDTPFPLTSDTITPPGINISPIPTMTFFLPQGRRKH